MQRGGNLFHSFSEFSVPAGGEAFFNNDASTSNIFSRVTGGSISTIDGRVRANGVNLFFSTRTASSSGRTPVGYRRLVLGATAEGVTVCGRDDVRNPGNVRAAAADVSVPVGLQFGENPGAIAVSGPGLAFPSFDFQPSGLQQKKFVEDRQESIDGGALLRVENERTLALVGAA